jgi:hypothetical protein
VTLSLQKITGIMGSYSEQQLIDCGYGRYGADGCNGAPAHAYLAYFANVRRGGALAASSQYPYLNRQVLPTLCRTFRPVQKKSSAAKEKNLVP